MLQARGLMSPLRRRTLPAYAAKMLAMCALQIERATHALLRGEQASIL